MIPLEPSYSGKCIFCMMHTHYRIARDDGMKHQVCEECGNSSRTIECAEEKYAIILEPYPVDGDGNSIRKGGNR